MDKKERHLKLVKVEKKENEDCTSTDKPIESELDDLHFITWDAIHHFIDLTADFIYENIPIKGIFSNSDDGTILAIMLSKELALPYIKNVPEDNNDLLLAIEVDPMYLKNLEREKTLRISIMFDPIDAFTPDLCFLANDIEYVLPWY